MSHVYSLDKNRPAITISDSTLEYVNVSKLLQVSISTSILIGMSTCKQRARAVMGQYKETVNKKTYFKNFNLLVIDSERI